MVQFLYLGALSIVLCIFFLLCKNHSLSFFLQWIALSSIPTAIIFFAEQSFFTAHLVLWVQNLLLFLILLDSSKKDIETRTVQHSNLIFILLITAIEPSRLVHSLCWGGFFFLLFLFLVVLNISPLPGGDMKFISALFFFYANSNAILIPLIAIIFVALHILLLKLRKKEIPKTVPFIPYCFGAVLVVQTLTLWNTQPILLF